MGVPIKKEVLIDRLKNLNRYDWIDLDNINPVGSTSNFDYTCNVCNSTQSHSVKTLIKRNVICKTCKFINDSRKKWGDTFDYTDVGYTGMRNTIHVTCSKHGVRELEGYYHQEFGCDVCSKENQNEYTLNSHKKSNEGFIKNAVNKHGDRFDYTGINYINTSTEINIRCVEHDHTFKQTPKAHLTYKHNCPKCREESACGSRDKYVPIWNKYHKDKYDYSLVPEMIKSSDTVTIICPTHGEFKQLADSHRKHGCAQCGIEDGRLSREEIQKRIRENQRAEYDYSLVDFDGILNTSQMVDVICPTHGVFSQRLGSHTKGNGCPSCKTSKSEWEVIEFIKDLDDQLEIIQGDKGIITPYELDIHIPKINTAIEYNGIYWHGENRGKDKKYHVNKTMMCRELGVSLIHIFENEWKYKRPIVESILRATISSPERRIYARNTTVKHLSNETYKSFCEENHIQGVGTIAKIKLGLYDGDELVSLMSFSKPRYNKSFEYEMMRYCNKLNTVVVGGASKLFKHFQRQYDPNSVITYSDRRYFTGEIYNKLGFVFTEHTPPNYFYFKSNNRMGSVEMNLTLHSRHKFQKHKLPKLLDIFDENKTEYQNMLDNGYDRIWDCGNSKYEWKRVE